MRLLKLLLILMAYSAVTSPCLAQTAFDDADAQLRVRQAATAASEAARKVEAARKGLETERQRVVATDGERDLNRATINALEQELRSAETKQREQDAALRAAQDARTEGLAAEAQRQKVEDGQRPQADVSELYKDAIAAANKGDHATALLLLRPLAEKGEARAQHNLGVLYERGQGVPQDYATAVSWFRKAADQGFSRAQYNLGVMYGNGHGVSQDYVTAVSWYRKAAEQGYAFAQYGLGLSYYLGKGVLQDYATAASWYRKAADQGHADAQELLARMYYLGQGVPQDYVQAHMWLNLSAAQGNANAVKYRNEVAAKMKPAQLAEAQQLASEWKPKPAR